MKNKGIVFFLVGLTLVIVGIIAVEFVSTRPDRQNGNPFEYDMTGFHSVDQEQILYRETRNLKLHFERPLGISCSDDLLFVAGDSKLVAIDFRGKVVFERTVAMNPLCVKATSGRIYLGGEKQILVLDSSGVEISLWDGFYDNTIITSLDVLGDKIFAADAGKRMVYRLNRDGEKELEFEGKVSDDVLHGFIVPSPCFDLGVNGFGDFWVANPGKHALENYTEGGELRGWWSAVSNDVKGFGGCCNPAHFTFLPDGDFITSEKGIVRIKEYRPSGEFVGVVAAPEKFKDTEHAPDVTCDNQGRIYALDTDKSMIRVFEKK